MANNANDVISIAQKEVGYSRWTDPQAGTKYGRWYAELTGNSYYGQSGVPYCAMFVSWVMAQAEASAASIPGAYCPWILTAGKNAGKIVATKNAQKGDLVLFDWEGDGVSDHIGFVVSNNGSALYTIEGNTNNGVVANRTRAYSTVIGIIRPNYNSSSSSSSSSSSNSNNSSSSSSSQIAVDGWWGKATTTAIQKQLGTTVDGIVSGQSSSNKKYLIRCDTGSWKFTGNGGSLMVRALQKKVGAGVDGYAGKETVTKLQTWLNKKGNYGLSVDGYCGPATVQAVQKALNSGYFK